MACLAQVLCVLGGLKTRGEAREPLQARGGYVSVEAKAHRCYQRRRFVGREEDGGQPALRPSNVDRGAAADGRWGAWAVFLYLSEMASLRETSQIRYSIKLTVSISRYDLRSYVRLAAIGACSSSTAFFSWEMTPSGSPALNIAVPATTTLLPTRVR